jgi:hypothetical protein
MGSLKFWVMALIVCTTLIVCRQCWIQQGSHQRNWFELDDETDVLARE